MHVPVCDICMKKCDGQDLRYVSIVKVDDDRKEHPIMTEKEICVHCAEKIKKSIEAMS